MKLHNYCYQKNGQMPMDSLILLGVSLRYSSSENTKLSHLTPVFKKSWKMV